MYGNLLYAQYQLVFVIVVHLYSEYGSVSKQRWLHICTGV